MADISIDPCHIRLVERVSNLETELRVRFEERDKARNLARENLKNELKTASDYIQKELELARKIHDKEQELAKEVHDKERERTQEQVQFKLDIQNNYQKKIDRLESTFSPISYVDDKVAILKENIRIAEENVKEYYNSENKILIHKTESNTRLIYVGFGVFISLQIVFSLIMLILRHLGV